MKILILALLLCSSLLTGCMDSKNQTTKDSASAVAEFRSFEPFPTDYSKNNILCAHVTDSSVWLGTDRGALEYSLDLKDLKKQYLEGEKVFKLNSYKGTVYAATEKKGLHVLPKGQFQFYHSKSSKIRDFTIDPETGNIYCATSHGVDIWKDGSWFNTKIKSSHEYSNKANDVTAVARDSKGGYWFGTSFGVYRMLSESSFDFFYGDYQVIQGMTIINHSGNSPLKGNLFYNIYSSPEGEVYFATNGGAAVLKQPDGGRNSSNWTVYNGQHKKSVMQNGQLENILLDGNSPIPSNFINDVMRVRDTLYVATSKGLSRLRDNTWVTFNLDNQLLGDTVHSLSAYETIEAVDVYVCTNGGLTIIHHPKTL
jgi:ligand-binding sensor domain-containing protein